MLPDMADVLTEWEIPVKLKTVTRQTVDFVDADVVVVADIKAVVQVAQKERLNTDAIDWSLRYLQVHSKEQLTVGQFIEFEGEDYKIIDDGNYQLYGFSDVVAEQTKRPLIEATPSVDKSALLAALNAASQLDEEDYTPESWAVLDAAVTAGQGVYDDADATQQQVDDATMAILDAIDQLVPAAPACAFPLSGDIAALIPGAAPLVVSGADSQTVSTGVDPDQPTYVASSSIDAPFSIDWPNDEIRWVRVRPISEAEDSFGSNYMRGIFAGLASLSGYSVFMYYYREKRVLPVERNVWRVNLYNSTGTLEYGGFPDLDNRPDKLFIGYSGAGNIYIYCDGILNTVEPPTPIAKDGLALFTQAHYDGGSATGVTSGEVITDASQFAAGFPYIAGIAKQADLCGNEVTVHPPIGCAITLTGDSAGLFGWQPMTISGQTASFIQTDPAQTFVASTNPESPFPPPESGNVSFEITSNITGNQYISSGLFDSNMGAVAGVICNSLGVRAVVGDSTNIPVTGNTVGFVLKSNGDVDAYDETGLVASVSGAFIAPGGFLVLSSANAGEGETGSAHVKTAASDYTLTTYPAGTLDWCGNAIEATP